MNKRIAVYAGSFDPVTNGHLHVISQGIALFDHLIVAVAVDPRKKYSFNLSERLEMLQIACQDLPVTVDSFTQQYTAHFAKSVGAEWLLRGMRSTADWEHEKSLADFNAKIAPEIQTVILPPSAELTHISSSLVRSAVGPEFWHETVRKLVPLPVYQKLVSQRFMELWTNWWQIAGGDQEAGQRLGLKAIEVYTQPDRHYHDLVHITKMLEEFEVYHPTAVNPIALARAIVGHDWVYQALSSINEAQSVAEFRRHLLEAGVPEEEILPVEQLIMATKDHNASSPDAQLMVDLDISILGQPQEIYDAYAEAIRQEYAIVPDADYQAGRIKVIDHFLQRDAVYHTAACQNKYEHHARANLTRERQNLAAE